MNQRRRPPRRLVNGVLMLDKPFGMSSNDALQKARRLLNAAKAGHTGTLDPMATGLLPLTFGEATKFSQTLLDADKGYIADVRLGVTTTTGDAEGELIEERSVLVSAAEIEQAFTSFTGEIDQIPPMFSALKRDGKPLYEYARAGIELERAPRRVSIYQLRLLSFSGDGFVMEVCCSKGTYIRTLAEDIGRVLGCGAHLRGLRRTSIGPFAVASAIDFERLEAAAEFEREGLLAPVDALLADLPIECLDPGETGILLNGGRLKRSATPAGRYRAYGPNGFIGLAELRADGFMVPLRLLSTQVQEEKA
ncbi:tRNA pseudouridine(55) synthase TruB [Cognatazoarcus halotolerans]|uniref:tRNA pseudouridine(55) synthase TruB n=1 Tax=Cognatazoarcus halotolerans TaxID=2686016 RepID=UPI00135AD86C|nr:tRNA pseudouridine(55) synthase TruB [Cognatazoarcus halotolerans]MCB1898866.1 tRNA pseudouridine(55) synthase TruB [Rhodocyclaceae bacterium]MCP5309085.1 tRNA pseudouridine(55) synthase TruB [Zoogloeaceae bacterium]